MDFLCSKASTMSTYTIHNTLAVPRIRVFSIFNIFPYRHTHQTTACLSTFSEGSTFLIALFDPRSNRSPRVQLNASSGVDLHLSTYSKQTVTLLRLIIWCFCDLYEYISHSVNGHSNIDKISPYCCSAKDIALFYTHLFDEKKTGMRVYDTNITL